MKLSEHQIKTLIAQGEGISLEFKTCRDQLTRDVYQTVCAFLNRSGGTVLLGVRDAGRITGIAPEAVDRIRKGPVNRLGCAPILQTPGVPGLENAGGRRPPGTARLMAILAPDSAVRMTEGQ